MITKLKYGNTNTFFIRGTNGGLLVDTDYAGTLPAFYRAIKEKNIRLCDISHVMATHYHPDHMGLISELMKQNIKLILPDIQVPYIHFADDIYAREKMLNYQPINRNEAMIICLGESRAFLKNMGIMGEIISTPSHSEDSVSLILDSGECFVGDLEPMEYLDGYERKESLRKDWECMNRYRPKVIHYAHVNEKTLK